jgi:SSU ribosomal protein S30E
MPSHGSVTKAGKVRSATPKIEPKPKEFPPPRIRNRRNYIKRILNAQMSPAVGRGAA